MKKFLVGLSALAFLLYAAPSHAQAARTWVSGTGDDSFPCSRTQPCLTFGAALALTTAGGEINVLDPGGFGGNLIINKSVSIYNDGAGEAGILVSSGNGIVINAGPTDVVNLRGLTLNGQGTGLGIHVLAAGRVNIQNCVIQQFGTGVNVPTSVDIRVKIQDSTIINNTNGVSFVPGTAVVNAAIDRSRIDNNSGIGVIANGAFGGAVGLAMADSSASLNGIHGVVARSTGNNAHVAVTLMRNNFVGNQQFGVQADGATSFVAVGDSMFANILGGAVQFVSGGVLVTYGTNQIFGPAGTGFSGPIGLQ
jgi:hypothetical protein